MRRGERSERGKSKGSLSDDPRERNGEESGSDLPDGPGEERRKILTCEKTVKRCKRSGMKELKPVLKQT